MPSESGNIESKTGASASTGSHRFAARVAGYFLVVVFFGLSATSGGYWVAFPFPFSASTVGELRLWLASALLLFPASCLLGVGYAADVAPVLRRLWSWAGRLDGRTWVIALSVALFTLAIAYRLGNYLILHDYPVTDDEYAAQFGGRVLATGRLMVPLIQPSDALPIRFMFVRDGMVTAQDFIGVLVAWAVAGATRLGAGLFALAAAVSAVFTAAVVRRRIGNPWVVLGLAMFVLSPMSLALSITTHSHLLSRALLAVALYLYVTGEDTDRRWPWLLCGVSLSASFACRPFETAFLAAPFALLELWRAVRAPESRRRVALVLAGAAPIAALFIGYSFLVTGSPFMPPKFAAGSNRGNAGTYTVWKAFGSNLSQNFFLLETWFLGPLGVLLVAFGALVDRFTKLMTASMLSMFVLAMLHLDTGIHIVGPIHYSETLIPLTVLAAAGTAELKRRVGALGISWATPASVIAFALCMGLPLFALIHGLAMERQASIQSEIYGEIAKAIPAGSQKAVLVAPEFDNVRNSVAAYAETGSWVYSWRRPQPSYDDDVLIVVDRPGVAAGLMARYPERRFFRLLLDPLGGYHVESISSP